MFAKYGHKLSFEERRVRNFILSVEQLEAAMKKNPTRLIPMIGENPQPDFPEFQKLRENFEEQKRIVTGVFLDALIRKDGAAVMARSCVMHMTSPCFPIMSECDFCHTRESA